MAFQQFKLTKSINQSRGIFDKFVYRPDNGDLIEDIKASGYFTESRFIPDPDWVGAILEIDAADGFLITRILANNDIEQLFNSAVSVNPGYSSIQSGGEITINTDTTKYNVAAGSGIIVDFTNPLTPLPTLVVWSAFTAVSPPDVVGDGFTSIAIGTNEQIVQLGGAQFTPNQFRLNIVLGTVVHTTTFIDNTISSPVPGYNVEHGILDYIRRAGGIVDGSRLILSNADLTFEQTGGQFTSPFINYANDKLNPSVISNAAANPKSFSYSRTDGSGGFVIGSTITSVDPDNFDDLSGSLVSVTAGNWTFQAAYFFGQLNILVNVYGQNEYATIDEAVDGIGLDFADMLVNPAVTGGATLLGFFVLQEGATDLTDDATAKFFSIGQALSGGSTITVTDFDQLDDTPPSKIGFADNVPIVSDAETALEYIAAPNLNSLGHAGPDITGLDDGGFLTLNGTTDVDIVAGSGFIVDFSTAYLTPTVVPISWITQTLAVPNLGITQSSFLFVDATGVVQAQNTRPTALDRRTKVQLGLTINNISASEILSVLNTPNVVGNSNDNYRDQFSFTGVLRQKGSVRQTDDTVTNGDLAVHVEGMDLFYPNINWHNDRTNPNVIELPDSDPAQWLYTLQTGDVIDIAAVLIDPLQFDDGGVLTSVPVAGAGRRTTIQHFFRTISGGFAVLYGQTVYDDLEVALNALDSDIANLVVPIVIAEYSTHLAAILVTQNCVDLGDITTAIIRQVAIGGGASGSVSPSMQNTYNVGELIVTNATQSAVKVQVGADGLDTDFAVTVKNTLGADVLSVTGEGYIDVVGPIGIGPNQPTAQGASSVAIGVSAGLTTQGSSSVSVGLSAGSSLQGSSSVAIGANTAATSQGVSSVAVGHNAGGSNQGTKSVAVGYQSGRVTQGINGIAIGDNAGEDSQQGEAVSIGHQAGRFDQASHAIALGTQSGQTTQSTQSIAIGRLAGNVTQGEKSVAIGAAAGQTDQGTGSVAIGNEAAGSVVALESQGDNAVAIGSLAGKSIQGDLAVALGFCAGQFNQATDCVAIGDNAGKTNQGVNSTAVGAFAGNLNQQFNATALGIQAGQTSQAENATALGTGAGSSSQGSSAVAIGSSAAFVSQGSNAVAIGKSAAQTNQGVEAVAIGKDAGRTSQGTRAIAIGLDAAGASASQSQDAIAIGTRAGESSQRQNAIAIGLEAGAVTQLNNAIAIGQNAGGNFQGTDSISIGINAGNADQAVSAIAIGNRPATVNQGINGIAIGQNTGGSNQGTLSIAMGRDAAQTSQGTNAIGIGNRAARTGQGNFSIAIGDNAGEVNQGANGIVISSSGVTENDTSAGHIVLASDDASMKYTGSTGKFTFDKPVTSPTTIESDPAGVTGADQVINMMSLTQAEYDAIGTPNASTFFIITDA